MTILTCDSRFRRQLASAVASALLIAFPAGGKGVVDNSSSPHAMVRSVGLEEVRWTRGLWAGRVENCRQKMIPAIGSHMQGTNHTHYLQNFRIAAGLAEGRHRGAPFNDGDFYKWLASACAMFAVTNDSQLERVIEEVIPVIAKAQ